MSSDPSTTAILLVDPFLIRGFGVQVPGGAPVLTWGNVSPCLPF
jgi:hypothetical protein